MSVIFDPGGERCGPRGVLAYRRSGVEPKSHSGMTRNSIRTLLIARGLLVIAADRVSDGLNT
jgi:hypothetical protein